MKLHPHRDSSSGKWFAVSSAYEEASPGNVGGGMIIATPHDTRKKCREAIKARYAEQTEAWRKRQAE